MPFFKQQTAYNNSIIGIWNITETFNELKNNHLGIYTQYQNSINALSLETQKQAFICARIILHKHLLINQAAHIQYQPNKKPYLQHSNYKINISHTKNWVAVIINPTRQVGIDIENIHERVYKVAQKFLNNNELKHINPNNITILTLLWTAKEALYKLNGINGLIFSEHLILNTQKMVAKLNNQYLIPATLIYNNTHTKYTIQGKIINKQVIVSAVSGLTITT